jgi:hypothetical protein
VCVCVCVCMCVCDRLSHTNISRLGPSSTALSRATSADWVHTRHILLEAAGLDGVIFGLSVLERDRVLAQAEGDGLGGGEGHRNLLALLRLLEL